MNPASKNKLLLWLIALLVVANIASITLFWLGKGKQPAQPKGTPNEFLVKELKLDTKQQEQLELLVKDHRQAAEQLRAKTREAKETFFDLLKQSTITDSIKKVTAKKVSVSTEELDLLTLEHFQKVRAICTPEQQKKFDEIIHELTRMMAQPRPPMGNGPQGPPPGGPNGDRPPPPEQ
jgi:periplasmic protein CpxP/Spy